MTTTKRFDVTEVTDLHHIFHVKTQRYGAPIRVVLATAPIFSTFSTHPTTKVYWTYYGSKASFFDGQMDLPPLRGVTGEKESQLRWKRHIEFGHVYFPARNNPNQTLVFSEDVDFGAEKRKPVHTQDCTTCWGDGLICPVHKATYEEFPMDGCVSCGHPCEICPDCESTLA